MNWSNFVLTSEMYANLGISTWELKSEGREIGRVIVDGWKQTAHFTFEGQPTALTRFLAARTFDWWMDWLKVHTRDPF